MSEARLLCVHFVLWSWWLLCHFRFEKSLLSFLSDSLLLPPLKERMAVLCRCSPSFWRVGHVELFAQRGTSELNDLLWHLVAELLLRATFFSCRTV